MVERLAVRYATTLDRAGLALGAGSAACGLIAGALVLAAGQRAPLTLAATLLLGMMFSALGITAVAGPVWVLCHASGRRGPGHAAALGAICCLIVLVFAQTDGFGLLAMPDADAHTLAFRWASAVAVSALAAVVAAGVGLAMWRVAYRREPPAG